QATCYRILKTLERADWIRRNEDDGYDLSAGLLPIAKRLVDVERSARAVQPLLQQLAEDHSLTAKLSLRLGIEQTTLAVAQPRQAFNVAAPVGSRYPVVWGASGAALLSQLTDEQIDELIESVPASDWGHEQAQDLWERIQRVRKKGVCDNIGLHPKGIDTIAAPIASWAAPCAITLIGLRGDITTSRLSKLRAALVDAAGQASAVLSGV
ncbi:MAG: IclR family transcriptional regulator C-terminal domain-containing protein, partial [Planctomycetota bacterium]